MGILEKLTGSFLFWSAWIVLPLIMEIIPSIGSIVVLVKRWADSRKIVKPILYPEISIIIPVYNSMDTLEACIRSINDCDYENSKIRLFLVNNQGQDDSFSIFTKCQRMFPDLLMQWLNAKQGKSRALNLAIYNSEGKYIVHLDSDGLLEPSALTHLVNKFEADSSLNCMTGVIMTNPSMVELYPRGPSRLMRKMEFLEYAQAFLAGRNYSSELNTIYTLSGAFSAFRKSALLKSRLYNTDTICEDTQITFQMRYLQKEKIKLSEHSIFFVDPIENVNKLYVQRQRWQRGSLEVARMFMNEDRLSPAKLATDVNVRTLMYDHTFAFPRMIWYLALFCLMFVGYSAKTIAIASALLFGMYTVIGYCYFFAIRGFLSSFPELRRYYTRQWYVIPLLPFFNLFVFFFRLAGIINSINTDSAWKTRNFTDECDSFFATLKHDLSKPGQFTARLRNAVNGDPKVIYGPRSLEKSLRSSFWRYFLALFLAFFSVTLAVVCHWSSTTLSVTLREIVNTLLGPLAGAGNDMLISGLQACLPPLLLFAAAACILVILDRRQTRWALSLSVDFLREMVGVRILRRRRFGLACVAVMLCASLVYANACYDVVGYTASLLSQSSVYEEYYVDPNSVAITPGENTKNLIYIYVESLENTYASTEDGGIQPVNYMPGLTRLARENISFSNLSGGALGGFFSNTGSTWTMAALYTTSSGIPYALPLTDEDVGEMKQYASGLTTLGDILKAQGYVNEFMCGSEATFAGRKTFFQQHGDYEIFDYVSAKADGHIPPDYHVWWGFEDAKLFQFAQEEAARLASSGQPFNLTLLTVDTHFKDGYLCSLCGDEYPEVTANVVSCTDRLVSGFVEWCQRQPFYEDTVIVITGDHPRMDDSLVGKHPWDHRRVYNCFINPSTGGPFAEEGREFAAMDIFPTVLSAMGFQIEGDHLGLGTNLFSPQRTLAEALGVDRMEAELAKSSDFYVKTFAPELLVNKSRPAE